MRIDPAQVRQSFRSLSRPNAAAHFDGPGGTQTPECVGSAIAAALAEPLANRGVHTAAERNAERLVAEARDALGDLLGADPRGVVFGRSMTQLTMDISRTLAADWGPGDQVVVTRLDHDANIRPWVIAAERAGASVVWVNFDPQTSELPIHAIAEAVGPRTRLVAYTAASNLIGTMPDVAQIARVCHDAGALCYLDAVHYAAHELVDLRGLGVDFVACSPYKFCGPHLGVLAADPALLETLHPDKLLPSTDAVPERFELGTLPYELLAGTTAAVDFLACLASDEIDRRTALAESYAALGEHEAALRIRIEDGLRELGATLYSRAARRTPTLLFSLPGIDSAQVYATLAARGVNAPASSFYALECSRSLGLGDTGAVRVGLAPYNDDHDVDRLLDGLRESCS